MFVQLLSWIQSLRSTERGQDLIEYALLSGLIALAIIGTVLAFSGALTSMAGGVSDCIDFDNTTACAPF
jgi:Flp pilus assembly pilin Flp